MIGILAPGAVEDLPGAAARCASAKLRALGQAVRDKARCHAAAVLRAVPVDASCLQRTRRALDAAVARADGRGGCSSAGDASLLDAAGDALVGAAIDLLVADPIPTATPVPTPTPTPGAPTATPAPTVTPAGDCGQSAVWVCCIAGPDPQLGSCIGAMLLLPENVASFASYCETRAGIVASGRCPAAQCGAPVACCEVGSCWFGTTEVFGSPDPDAFGELCTINGYSFAGP